MAADTFSSELGILAQSRPRLLTSWTLREVPPGTNGGVTVLGTIAGFLGAFVLAFTTVVLLPFCSVESSSDLLRLLGSSKSGLGGGDGWAWQEKALFVVLVSLWGGCGSLLDSALGGWLQASVVDTRTGKVVEGHGGRKVSNTYVLLEDVSYGNALGPGLCIDARN